MYTMLSCPCQFALLMDTTLRISIVVVEPLIYQNNIITVLFFLTERHKTVPVSLNKAEDNMTVVESCYNASYGACSADGGCIRSADYKAELVLQDKVANGTTIHAYPNHSLWEQGGVRQVAEQDVFYILIFRLRAFQLPSDLKFGSKGELVLKCDLEGMN